MVGFTYINHKVFKMPITDSKTLVALALFRVDPRSAECRTIIYQSLVEITLLTSGSPLTSAQIHSKILEILEQRDVISFDECKKAIKFCLAQGNVIPTDYKYTLSDERRGLLLQQQDIYIKSQDSFDKNLINCVESELGSTLNEIARALLCGAVKNVIQSMFYDKSVELQRTISQGKCDYKSILAAGSKYNPLDNLVRSLEPVANIYASNNKKAFIDGVKKFFTDLSDDHILYLISLHHRIFYLQILNIDPRLIELQKRCFANIRLYLDTNVVIALLFDSHPEHKAVKDLLDACQTLNISLFVSPVTYNELSDKIEQSKKLITITGEGKASTLIADTKEGRGSEPIIASFIRRKRLNDKLSWGGFIAPFEDTEVYLMHLNILKEKEGYDGVTSHEHYHRVRQVIKSVRSPSVNDNVIDHDAENFILIHLLRSKYPDNPVFGPSVWLLTKDHSLKRDEEILSKLFPVGHSKLIEEWGQMLLPFQNIGQFVFSDYITYLIVSGLGAMIQSPALDFSILNLICNPEFSLDDFFDLPLELQLKIISGVQKDRNVREIRERAALARTPDEKIKVAQDFRNKELEILSEEKTLVEEHVKSLSQEIADLRNKFTDISKKAGEQDATLIEISKKLESAEAKLNHYESMSFLDKLKSLFPKNT